MRVTNPIPEYELVAPKEAIIAWKHNAVTQQVLQIIRQERQTSDRRIGGGETLGENIIQDTARAVGYSEGLDFLLTTMMEVTQVVEDSEDRDGKDAKDSATVR